MYPVVIQTRFDKTSSFDGILSESKIDNDLAFQVSPHKLRVHPNDEGIFYVTFSPMGGNEGIYTGAIKIRSKHKSFTILLRGEAYYSNEDRELHKQLNSQVNDSNRSITSTYVTTTPNPSTINITPSTVDTVDIVNAVVDMNKMADEYIKRKYMNDDVNLDLLLDEKKQHLKEWISKTKSLKKGKVAYHALQLCNNTNEELNNGAGDLISSMLGPAIVSFASIIGLVSSSLLNKLINIQPYEVAASTLTRCITSPLALAGAEITGADPTLSALIVVLTGLFGAAFGQLFLNVIKTDDPLSVGLAMGAAAHGLGASSLANEPEKFSGAIVSMTLTGLFTVILLSIESFRNLL
eukprot:gene17893-23510_t